MGTSGRCGDESRDGGGVRAQVTSLENWGVDCFVRLGAVANGYKAESAEWSKRERCLNGERREGNLFA